MLSGSFTCDNITIEFLTFQIILWTNSFSPLMSLPVALNHDPRRNSVQRSCDDLLTACSHGQIQRKNYGWLDAICFASCTVLLSGPAEARRAVTLSPLGAKHVVCFCTRLISLFLATLWVSEISFMLEGRLHTHCQEDLIFRCASINSALRRWPPPLKSVVNLCLETGCCFIYGLVVESARAFLKAKSSVETDSAWPTSTRETTYRGSHCSPSTRDCLTISI